MGMMGGVARALGGAPKYSTISSVKNTDLQRSIDSSIGGLPQLQRGVNQGLNTFTQNWNAATPEVTAETGQETGAIGQFYNGQMANQLAGLRTQRQQSVNAAANVATQQALAAQSRSRLTGSGGMGSYNQRQTIAALQPIRVQAALDNSNQERADLGYVTQNQVGLAGTRESLQNQLAGRALVPGQQRLSTLGQENQYMSGLANLDQANKFYGLQKDPNVAADILDSFDQGILNGVAAYSSVSGGMGKKEGGLIRGPGTGTSDSIPARLSKGEFVIPADVVHIPGVLPLLEKLRHLHTMHHVGRHQEGLKIHLNQMKQAKATTTGTTKMAGGGMARGYADGGLAGSAQQLGARVDADLSTDWMPPTILPTDGGVGNGDPYGIAGGQPRATAMPGGGGGGGGGGLGGRRGAGGGFAQSPYLNMSNWNSVSPQWQSYANSMAEKYSNPNSPSYIAPGTYE